MQVVLERGAGKEQPITAVQLAQALRDLAVLILELVCLIYDDVLPLEGQQLVHAGSDALERSQHDIELAGQQVVLQELFSLGFRRDEVEHTDLGAPLLELVLPVWDDCLGHDHHEVALHLLELTEECQEADRLDRLSQSLSSNIKRRD